MPPEASLIIVMGTLALPQYAAGVQLLPVRQRMEEPRAGRRQLAHRRAPSSSAARRQSMHRADRALARASALSWRPKVWAIAAACFWVPFILLSTTFFSNSAGLLLGDLGLAGLLAEPAGRAARQPAGLLLLHHDPGVRIPAAGALDRRGALLRDPRQDAERAVRRRRPAGDPGAAAAAARARTSRRCRRSTSSCRSRSR